MTAIMKIHFTLLIIVMSLSVQAQKMVTKTAEWNYMHEEFDVPTTSWRISRIIEAKYLGADSNGSDTIINGKEYLLFNTAHGSVLLFEDTIKNQVFVRASSGVDPDYLLYDFSVEKGDTVVIDVPGQWYYLYHVIDTAYYIHLSGDSLKTFGISVYTRNDTISSPFSFYNFTTWYDGMGSQEDILQPIFGDFLGSENISNLFCYSDTVLGIQFEPFVYFDVDTGIHCNFNPPISIHEFAEEQEDVLIYPNPFSESLIIESSGEKGMYYLYDMQGNVLSQGLLSESKTSIQTDGLPPGLYVLKINKDFYSVTQKLHKR
ncbi:MAG: T9SS type A sorting domain-containing protein [Cryomorphaceae bacterium]|nr:T9SS type A sorting domain-containing protein [Cryomorphaceae bacterium]